MEPLPVINERPYPPTGINTEIWKTLSPEAIKLKDLVLTQDGLSATALMSDGKSWCGDLIPHVVRYKGVNYLEDGHHRVVRSWIRGHEQILVRIYRQS